MLITEYGTYIIIGIKKGCVIMKKIKYQLLGVIILTMVFCMQTYANADTIEGKCGKSCTYSYDTDTKEIVISGTGEITDNPWVFESYANDIKTVTIKDGITAIRVHSLFGKSKAKDRHPACKSIEKVDIAKSVKTVGFYAFCCCKELKSVTMPGVEIIKANAFCGCDLSDNFKMPANIKKIGGFAFAGTKIGKGKELLIRKDIVYGAGVFSNSGYKKVIYEDGIKVIKPVVVTCRSVRTVVLPSSATKIGGAAFCSCYNLRTIKIPKKVKVIEENAFCLAKKLKKVVIKSKNIKEIKNCAFSGIENVTIYVPKDKYDEYSKLVKESVKKATNYTVKELSK